MRRSQPPAAGQRITPALAWPLCAALALVCVTAPAFAGDPPASVEEAASARARALELFAQSERLYQSGDFRESARLLEQAYETFPEPVLLYNLARARERAHDIERAIAAYEKYLAADPEVHDRGAIELKLTALRARARSPETPAPATQPEPQPQLARTEEKPSGVPPTPQREVRRAAKPAPVGSARSSGSLAPAPWIVAAVGGAALIGGVGLALRASERHAAAQGEPQGRKAAELQAESEDFAHAATIVLVSGGVVASVGTAWGILSFTSQPSASGGSRAAPNRGTSWSAALSGRF